MLLAERHESERLRQIIKELQRHRFGRMAETLPEEQMLLGLEDVQQVAACTEASQDETAPEARAERARKRRNNRGALPAHLPRIEVVVDLDAKTCPCCQGELHRIGEDKSERLDMVPAQFRVVVTRRPKYACRACEDGVLQAQAPARLLEGGLPTEATVAQVLVSKYADHLPLYRQAQIYARQGIALDRSTLADWVGHAAFHLRPLHERLLTVLRARSKLFADETTVPVLDPGRGRTKTDQLWAYAADDRPWGGLDPPGILCLRNRPQSRAAVQPSCRLRGRPAGRWLQRLPKACRAWRGRARLLLGAHAAQLLRTRDSRNAPIASEALKHIAAFYAIEKEIRARNDEERRLMRQQKSRPLADAFEGWLRAKLALISQKIKLAEAIRYALSRWQGLTRFIDDGRIELDNNTVERSIRGIKLSRKNALFAGSGGGAEHWAVVASLVETCKINDVDPLAYLTDVLTRIVNGHPNRDIDQLVPWAYRTQSLKAVT